MIQKLIKLIKKNTDHDHAKYIATLSSLIDEELEKEEW